MKPYLQAFLEFITDMKAKANAAIAKMPPLEQFETSSELAWVFRQLQRQANETIEFADAATRKMNDLSTQIQEGATAEARQALITSGEFVPKADHVAAVTAAANSREAEVRQAITAEAAQAEKITARRKQIIEAKILPAIAAERMPIDLLSGDTFMANAELVKGRIAKLEPFGITAEKAPLVVADLASIGFDAAGNDVFEHRLRVCEQAAGAHRKAAGGENPLAGAGTAAAASAEAQGGDDRVRRLM